MTQYIIIKIGGSTLTDMHETIITDIKALRELNIYPIIVHGGGPFINKALQSQSIAPQFIDGLRVTDEQTLDITRQTLLADVNTAIVARFNQYNCHAIGLNGLDGQLFNITPLNFKYGYVAEPSHLNTDTLTHLCSTFIPIISSIGYNYDSNQFYNINADTLAYYIAASLKAPIYVLSNTYGVIVNDKVLSMLKTSNIDNYIASGDIYGGMIPKVREAQKAISLGCSSVVIACGSTEHIINNIYHNDFIGTVIS
ncbi:acetylglutamate kinase [Staphylococcus simiae]|uniref:Acetylglutamate kinase n=1 Tax=Staphylococcus simiae CCM 7213 = CCUG 51256 TaxID=911238 RepID=G5JGU3_9STAP|nr:acetylglutamate kinase [Staphylococcus simiae]EHJ08594.1 acetylglutamate kinase [Staphylococcus simiae CCM 7213 = CCUG 51256]PNZ14537.1 acetylglutamate kinase [Staphylococcus simiae]SNV57786.1 acetylglutamate kinase [Staphylococcus simiae]